jgi:hypothetical protein
MQTHPFRLKWPRSRCAFRRNRDLSPDLTAAVFAALCLGLLAAGLVPLEALP